MKTVEAWEPALAAVVERLAHALGPERIVLFGSHARGLVHQNSDIDLLLIGRWDAGGIEHWQRRAQMMAAGSLPRIDLVLCTPEDLENESGSRWFFLRSAVEQGRVLYARNSRSISRA